MDSATPSEVEKLIGSALNKSCMADEGISRSILSPFIALLFNESLAIVM
jgi:hypothetical protein